MPPEDSLWLFQMCSLPACVVYRCRRERQTPVDNNVGIFPFEEDKNVQLSKRKGNAPWTSVACHKTGKEISTFNISSSTGITRSEVRNSNFLFERKLKGQTVTPEPAVFKGVFRFGLAKVKCSKEKCCVE